MKYLMTLILLTAFTMGSWAQETAESATPDAEKTEEAIEGPKLSLESTTVDYGEITQGSDPLRVVSFTNTGTEPLIISNARGSCGCTVPTWPREPIGPGESAEIEIRYDTKRLGGINKTVKLTTNDETGTYVIRVKGNISPQPAEEGLPKKDGIFDKPND